MDKQEIGKTLAALRKARGETLSDVAKAVGLTQNAISMYEIGARIPRDPIKKKLSQHFNVSVEHIFFGD